MTMNRLVTISTTADAQVREAKMAIGPLEG